MSDAASSLADRIDTSELVESIDYEELFDGSSEDGETDADFSFAELVGREIGERIGRTVGEAVGSTVGAYLVPALLGTSEGDGTADEGSSNEGDEATAEEDEG